METKQSYDIAMMSKMIGPSTQLNTAYGKLNSSINKYNEFINRQDVLNYSSSDATINQILANYFDSIDKLIELNLFANSAPISENSTLIKYALIAESAPNLAKTGMKSSGVGFSKYIYDASK